MDLLNKLKEPICKTNALNFTWLEALSLKQMEAIANPTPQQIANIIKLATCLQKIRNYYGKPIKIHSWLRTKGYNAMVGGAAKSYHTQGLAVDFSIEGLDCEDVKSFLQTPEGRNLWPYRGEKNTVGWIHLDMGPGGWFNA